MIASLDIAGYTEIVPIGQGGLGDVYRAVRASTGSTVALKVIRATDDVSTMRRRVEREVAALVQLRGHPFVVQVEEMVDTVHGPIVVMEFAPNGSLADLLKSHGRLSVPECVVVLEQVTIALRDAHARGILHRDIKPHNLLVGQFGQIKVCDFGIAAMTRGHQVDDRTNALSYRYASPEELEDRDDIGPPSDIYSLGVTMRHLATGAVVRPAPAHAPGGWLTAVDPADVEVARELAELVVAMLAARPEERPTADHILDSCESMSRRLGHRRLRSLDTSASLSTVLLDSLDSGHVDDKTRERPARAAQPFPPPQLPTAESLGRSLPRPNQAPVKWW